MKKKNKYKSMKEGEEKGNLWGTKVSIVKSWNRVIKSGYYGIEGFWRVND